MDQTGKGLAVRLRRGLWVTIGVVLFFWIGYEDRTTVTPILIGGLLATALSFDLAPRIRSGKIPGLHSRLGVCTLTGLISGALAMPLAALCMLVKLSLHSHVPPEYSAIQVLAVLERFPVWAGAGALAGLALALIRK